MITSEWGTPRQVENGLIPEELLANKYGHCLHFFDMKKRRNIQTIDEQYQMVLELRPAHDPARQHGFVGVVISTEDLSGSIWCWYKDGDRFAVKKVLDIPAEPCDDVDLLPDLLKGFKAVPPLITDIDLTVDDKYLFVSCFGQGRSIMLDVSDPLNVAQVGEIRVGGIVTRAPHPKRPDTPLLGAPQMVEVSRDGTRVYWTNSLYGAWDEHSSIPTASAPG